MCFAINPPKVILLERFPHPQLSYINKSAVNMLRETGVCVLSSDSGDSNTAPLYKKPTDSNLGSTLYSEGFRYSAVSVLNCAHLIQF
ncbi:hypothetical protein J6590_101643 [Homalodisca vitripennis]|nr:hypothetical protein J6590_101643 [Homalodisca vitripennis]